LYTPERGRKGEWDFCKEELTNVFGCGKASGGDLAKTAQRLVRGVARFTVRAASRCARSARSEGPSFFLRGVGFSPLSKNLVRPKPNHESNAYVNNQAATHEQQV
jgi:hypothetical protein